MHVVLKEPSLFEPLLEMAFNSQDRDSHRAAWIVELLCLDDIGIIEDHLSFFTDHLNNLTNDSAKRPMAKICSLICHPKNGLQLSSLQKEKIISSCFDWMIDDSAVAVKVYAMTALFQIGRGIEWIYPALLEILEQHYTTSSTGYKCRAKWIMAQIKA